MGDRGRKPAAELSVVQPVVEYPEPTEVLNLGARAIWDRTVYAMPVGWFKPETLDTLAQYCNHVYSGQLITKQMHELALLEDLDVDLYDRFSKMQDRESRASNALARSLRITLQSTYDKTKSQKGRGPAPWQKK